MMGFFPGEAVVLLGRLLAARGRRQVQVWLLHIVQRSIIQRYLVLPKIHGMCMAGLDLANKSYRSL